MSYLEQLHAQRTERLQRMKAWTGRAIVPVHVFVEFPIYVHRGPIWTRNGSMMTYKCKNGFPGLTDCQWIIPGMGNPASEEAHPLIRTIQRAVADHYGMEVDDLLSSRRTARLITPRHVAIYLAKKLTLRSLPAIGRQFAGRDHTTVLHAVRKVTGMMERDEQLKADVRRLEILLMRVD